MVESCAAPAGGRRRSTLRRIAASTLVLAAACDSGVSPGDVAIAQVQVTLARATIGVSETTAASASARDASGRILPDASFSWRSSHPDIATVTADGVVSGVSAGSASIIATSNPTSGTAVVNVVSTLPNVRVHFAYLMQVIQNPAGGIPLIAGGNPVLLRVFGSADRPFPPTSARPMVRVTMYHGESVVSVDERPLSGVASTLSQAIHEVVLPASLVQPGLSFRVELNPDSLVPEQTLSDNAFPRTETSAADVRHLQPLGLHFVPIVMTPFSDGTVTSADLPYYLGTVRQVYPVSEFAVTVGGSLTTTWRSELGEADALNTVLGQLDLVRLIEGSTAYYVGVVGPGTGFSGFAYIPGEPGHFGPGTHVSIIRAIRSAPLAHELAHNMGRRHARCAIPADQLDVHYPNEGGVTNISGADLYTASLDGTLPAEKPGTMFDLMSYCAPRWISAYTFTGILDWRIREDSALAATQQASPQKSLIVWGTVKGDAIYLEPSFIARVRPHLPHKPGKFSVDAENDRGAPLFSLSFDPAVISHSSSQHFLFAIPLSDAEESQLARLTVAGRGTAAKREIFPASFSPRSGIDDGRMRFSGLSIDRSLVTWDSSAHPLVIAREVKDGRVLGIGTSGVMTIATTADQVELILSNGLTSVVKVIKRK